MLGPGTNMSGKENNHELRRSGQFVVSMADAAYDAQVERLNRKVRQEAFIENSGLADFGVCAGVCCGNSVPGTRQGDDSL